jgi:hypothetical protein
MCERDLVKKDEYEHGKGRGDKPLQQRKKCLGRLVLHLDTV